MRGSEFFLKSVKKLGIENIFGIVGGESKYIKFNEEKGINFYLTRHEFTAGVMADVYARITGKPQMCYSTFGPGLTNLSTGVFSAIQDRSPMLVVSAQIPRKEIAFNQTHQCLDNVSFMKPITKYAASIENLSEIPDILTKALTKAINGIPGPVYISFSVDLMDETIDDQVANALLGKLSVVTKEPVLPIEAKTLDDLEQKLKKSKHPLIIVGNQIIRENCSDLLIEFARKNSIPVLSTLAAKGVMPENDPLFITPCNKYIDNIYQTNVLEQIFNSCDQIVLFGYDFGEDLKPSLWKNNTETILINSFYTDLSDIFQPDHSYIGDLQNSLEFLITSSELTKQIPKPLLDVKKKLDERLVGSKENHIPLIIQTLRKALGDQGILCSDIGLHKQYAGLLSKTHKPNTFVCSNVCGTFGFGLPAGLGAKLARPNTRVAVICGDGGFHSNSQDLELAIRYNLPIVIVLLKDNAFGLIKCYQLLKDKDYNANIVEFGSIDFVKLAEANGMQGVHIQNIEELETSINAAFEDKKPLLIEVPITYNYTL